MSFRVTMCCILVSCCGPFVSLGSARTWQDGISDGVATEDRSNVVLYRTYLPKDYDEAVEYPYVLYLHPNGQQGRDNFRQVSTLVTGLINRTYEQNPAILVAPQAPLNTSWRTPSTFDLVKQMLERTMDQYSVDSKRIYVTGVSMGGFGTLHYLDYFTNVEPADFEFAAAMPLASGTGYLGDVSEMAPYRDTPIWLMHGIDDQTVDERLSQDAFRSFTGLGPSEPIDFNTSILGQPTAVDDNVRYTEFQFGGHSGWVNLAYTRNEFVDWMFAQSLAVPEPASSSLMALAVVALVSARRKGS